MIDVIDPSSSKYGDPAEPVTSDHEASIGTGVTPATSSIPIVTRLLAATASTANEALRARGRGLALELDDDGITIDEDVEEAEEDTEDSLSLPITSQNHYHQSHTGSPLKASLLDYVLSEVAMNSSRSNNNGTTCMDLEPSAVVAPRRRKYAFNPEEPQAGPPHLSEYYERNVIAVLNRCDPTIWGRCYTCGNPPQVVEMAPTLPSSAKEMALPGGDMLDTFWNYKSDYRTTSSGSGYQYHSEPTSPWSATSAPPHQHHFFPGGVVVTMDGEESTQRMRCGSEASSSGGGSSGSTAGNNGDLDSNFRVGSAGDPVQMEDEEVFTFDVSKSFS